MDWLSGESVPDWRRATLGASARLGTLMCVATQHLATEEGDSRERWFRTTLYANAECTKGERAHFYG